MSEQVRSDLGQINREEAKIISQAIRDNVNSKLNILNFK